MWYSLILYLTTVYLVGLFSAMYYAIYYAEQKPTLSWTQWGFKTMQATTTNVGRALILPWQVSVAALRIACLSLTHGETP